MTLTLTFTCPVAEFDHNVPECWLLSMVMDVIPLRIGRSQSMSDHGAQQRPMSAGADKEIRIAVLGAQGVGKSGRYILLL